MHDEHPRVPLAGSEPDSPPAAETALLVGEEKYRSLFENMAEEVHFWRLVRDEAGEIVTWRLVDANPPALKTWGRSSVDEIRGKTTDEIFGEGATEHYLPVVRKIFSEGTSHSYEDYFPHLDKYFRFTSVPLGEYFITTGADITEVKKANAVLRTSEERFRRLFEAHEAAMLLIEPEGGQILDANIAATRFYGYSRRQLQKMRIQEINQLPSEKVASERKRAADRTKNVFIFRHRLASGEVRDVEVYSSSVTIQGRPTLFSIIHDVTARLQAEKALRQSRKDLDRAQAVGQIGWWRLDTREDVLTWSDENYRIFGVPKGTPMTYESFLACIHPDDREYVDTKWQAGVRGEPYDIEHRLLVGGRIRWVREKAFLEHDAAGGLLGGFGITQDITDLKLAEQALRESEAKRAAQQERARLARDLHDSVTQALFAATLKAEALTLAEDSIANGTSGAAEELRRLNRGALAEMRGLLLELRGEPLEEVPIGQLLRHLVEAAEGRAGVEVRLSISGDVQSIPELHMPIYRITQEALSNVTRHARASKAWVDLTVEPDGVHLVVGDDGRGFDPTVVDPSHIGLRSMRERAEEAGARLEVVTEPGGGTVIAVDWRRQ